MKSFTCIVPAYNEEKTLPNTLPPLLDAIKGLKEYKGRVLVVDNNSSDKTADVARSFGVDVIFEAVNQISKARNCGGFSCTDDDYLMFLDADTFMTPEILQTSLQMLDSGKYCGGGCLVKMENNSAPLFTGFWCILSRFSNLAAGAYIFCLNEAFKGSGGFNEEIYAAEDVLFSSKLKKWGRKNGRRKFKIITHSKIITSDRKMNWYSNFEVLKIFLILGIMPWRLKNRDKLGFWYKRPHREDDTNDSEEVKENNSQ